VEHASAEALAEAEVRLQCGVRWEHLVLGSRLLERLVSWVAGNCGRPDVHGPRYQMSDSRAFAGLWGLGLDEGRWWGDIERGCRAGAGV
jgi:hypothetical protein